MRKSFSHYLRYLLVPIVFGVLATATLLAQDKTAAVDYLDKILERREFTPDEINALDLGGGPGGAKDGVVDVRDLVIFFAGSPASMTFGSAESLAFHSAGSVTLPIYFSKPISGTIRFDLGGSARLGAAEDYTLLNSEFVIPEDAPVQSTEITLVFQPWRGIGGEKIVRFTLQRDPTDTLTTGTFSTHLLRIRQFDAGEFVGTLAFSGGSGLPSLPVRFGMSSTGGTVLSFQRESTLLGKSLSGTWEPGLADFPSFLQPFEISVPGEVLGKSNVVRGVVSFTRLSAPFSEEHSAYLEGFPDNDKPALYTANLSFHNLFAAGSNSENRYTVTYVGRLALQSVNYLNEQP